MSISMYQASVPVLQRSLGNLSAILTKAGNWATARKIDPSVLLASRLAPDMFPLTRQVQIACDFGKSTPARLSGIAPPKYEDTETSFAELQARLTRTLEYAATFKPAQIDGSEDREITLKLGPNEVKFTGQAYLLHFALPNFFFHLSMSYAILRHNGLDLAKADFIGAA